MAKNRSICLRYTLCFGVKLRANYVHMALVGKHVSMF